MADEFPSDFDFIVIGTGLPESILAAAFSRIGQRVLHIDRNGYYSGRWSSFNLHGVESWISQTKGEDQIECPKPETVQSLLKDREDTVTLEIYDKSYSHVSNEFHVGEDEVPVERDSSQGNNSSTSNNQSEDQSADVVITGDGVNDKTDISPKQDNNDKDKVEMDENGDNDKTGAEAGDQCSDSDEKKDTVKEKEKWTKTRLSSEWRKFNLDLTPKLLYCGGSMVQLLISSDIAKYCEFKTVTRMLTLLDGKLEKVPCSRADVFNSKEVSMLEKRMLMKFLTSCAEYEKNPTDYEAFSEKPFEEFLNSKKLTKNIKHFVQHSIAMATSETTTLKGLAKTKKFLHSLGRYGNTAFLWPLYGCGELPQSFCRMCAVFGGIYCLKMSASHLIIDQDKKCLGVISTDGKRLTAKHIILEESSIPTHLFNSTHKRYLLRAVLVTDKSILHDESQQLSVLQIPDKDGRQMTRVIELPPSSMSSPSPLYVVHVTKVTKDGVTSPESDLLETISTLFRSADSEDESKPVILWSLYFKREFYNDVTVDRTVVPDNVIVIPGPGPQIDLDTVVDQTKEIFEKLMPGEEFLPRPPNPEDIIYVDDAESTVASENNQSDFTNSDDNQSELKSDGNQSELKSGDNQLELKSGDNQLELKSGDNQSELKSDDNQSELKSDGNQSELKSNGNQLEGVSTDQSKSDRSEQSDITNNSHDQLESTVSNES